MVDITIVLVFFFCSSIFSKIYKMSIQWFYIKKYYVSNFTKNRGTVIDSYIRTRAGYLIVVSTVFLLPVKGNIWKRKHLEEAFRLSAWVKLTYYSVKLLTSLIFLVTPCSKAECSHVIVWPPPESAPPPEMNRQLPGSSIFSKIALQLIILLRT